VAVNFKVLGGVEVRERLPGSAAAFAWTRGFIVVVVGAIAGRGVVVRVLLIVMVVPFVVVVVVVVGRVRAVTLTLLGVMRLGQGVRRRPRRTGEGRLLRRWTGDLEGTLREIVLGGTTREMETGILLAVERFRGVGVGVIGVEWIDGEGGSEFSV
jgi:hypothetical protein